MKKPAAVAQRLRARRKQRVAEREALRDKQSEARVTARLSQQWAEMRASRQPAEPTIDAGPSNFAQARVPHAVDLAAAWSWRRAVTWAAGRVHPSDDAQLEADLQHRSPKTRARNVDALAEVLREEARHAPGHYDVIHSHYWLSGQVGWVLSQQWDVPLVHTMHTMARVKNLHLADGDAPEPPGREIGEAQVVGTADRLVANTPTEARELIDLYEADPDRVVVVPPGVDLGTFHPADRAAARRAGRTRRGRAHRRAARRGARRPRRTRRDGPGPRRSRSGVPAARRADQPRPRRRRGSAARRGVRAPPRSTR